MSNKMSATRLMDGVYVTEGVCHQCKTWFVVKSKHPGERKYCVVCKHKRKNIGGGPSELQREVMLLGLQRKCKNCGKLFVPGSNGARTKYCSDRCYGERYPSSVYMERRCKVCGQTFHGTTLCCSPACRNRTQVEHLHSTVVDKECTRCGETYRERHGNKGRLCHRCRFVHSDETRRQQRINAVSTNPSQLMLNGRFAESLFDAIATQRGWWIAMPIGDACPWDRVVQFNANEAAQRIQIKALNSKKKKHRRTNLRQSVHDWDYCAVVDASRAAMILVSSHTINEMYAHLPDSTNRYIVYDHWKENELRLDIKE